MQQLPVAIQHHVQIGRTTRQSLVHPRFGVLVMRSPTRQVAVTVTLALPSAKTTTPPQAASGEPALVAGYVFVDANENGMRDADEVGIGGVQVALTPPGVEPIRE